MSTFGPTIEAAAKLTTPPMDPALFAKSVRVRAPASTTFIEITGVGETAEQAADIANALAQELIVLATPPPILAARDAEPDPEAHGRPEPGGRPDPGAHRRADTRSPQPTTGNIVGVGTLTLVDPATPPGVVGRSADHPEHGGRGLHRAGDRRGGGVRPEPADQLRRERRLTPV